MCHINSTRVQSINYYYLMIMNVFNNEINRQEARKMEAQRDVFLEKNRVRIISSVTDDDMHENSRNQ